MAIVRITGWSIEAQVVSAIQELRANADVTLSEAHQIITGVLAGQILAVAAAEGADVDAFIQSMWRHGFMVEREAD